MYFLKLNVGAFMANQNEYFDQEESMFHYYTSKQEREKIYTQAYKEKLIANKRRAKRAKIIIIVDLLLIGAIFLFFKYAYLPIISTKQVEQFQFRGVLLSIDKNQSMVHAAIKIKRMKTSLDDQNAILHCSLNAIKKTTLVNLPTSFDSTIVAVSLPFEQPLAYIDVIIEIGESKGELKIPLKKISLL